MRSVTRACRLTPDAALKARTLRPVDRALADRALADRALADRALADRALADRALADRASADRALADRALADRALARRAEAQVKNCYNSNIKLTTIIMYPGHIQHNIKIQYVEDVRCLMHCAAVVLPSSRRHHRKWSGGGCGRVPDNDDMAASWDPPGPAQPPLTALGDTPRTARDLTDTRKRWRFD